MGRKSVLPLISPLQWIQYLEIVASGQTPQAAARKSGLEMKQVRDRVRSDTTSKEDFRLACVHGNVQPCTNNTEHSGKPFGNKRGPEYRGKILATLSAGKSATAACRAADISLKSFCTWRKDDPSFDEEVRFAVEEGTDRLVDEAFRRAHDGTLRPVFQQGECVGHVKEYSDTLMITLLKARRPNEYGNRVEHTGPEGGPIQHSHAVQKEAEAFTSTILGIATRVGENEVTSDDQ